MSAPFPARLRVRRLWVLMVTAFVDMMGFALILPLLPLYATRFGARPFVIGLLLATFAFAQLITAPLWGRLSDRVGRRPVLLFGQILAAVAFALFAVADRAAPSPLAADKPATIEVAAGQGFDGFEGLAHQMTPAVLLLFICRLVQGAGGGTISVNQAYVSDVAGPEERAKALGWITAASSVGVMLGPAIGSFSVPISAAAPGVIAAAMAALNVLFVWRFLPESSNRAAKPRAHSPILPAIHAVLARPLLPVNMLISVYAIAMMAFMAMNAIMALFLAERFGITEESIGWFYVVVGAVSVVMRAVVLGRVVSLWGEVRVLRTGIALLAVGMVLAPLAQTPGTFLLAIALVPAGTAMLFPCTTSLVSRHAAAGEIGQTLGVQQSFGGMSRLLGPVLAGAIFQQVGARATFWTAACLVVLSGFAATRLHPAQAPSAERRAVEMPPPPAGP